VSTYLGMVKLVEARTQTIHSCIIVIIINHQKANKTERGLIRVVK
jgi:hypothetical protein